MRTKRTLKECGEERKKKIKIEDVTNETKWIDMQFKRQHTSTKPSFMPSLICLLSFFSLYILNNYVEFVGLFFVLLCLLFVLELIWLELNSNNFRPELIYLFEIRENIFYHSIRSN